MTKDQMVDTTTRAINAYCRVLELHMKAIAQGANPNLPNTSMLGKIMKESTEGLAREVSFLRFLREEDTDRSRASPGG